MTLTDVDVAEPTTSSRPVATPRDVWRAARAPIVIGAVVIAVALLGALLNQRRNGYLDPDATSPEGARALAEVLRDRDVGVTRRATVSGGARVTTFVPIPELVDPAAVARLLATPGQHVVLVEPPDDWLDVLDSVDAAAKAQTRLRTLEPACSLAEAVRAGTVHLGGTLYESASATHQCYATGGRAALLRYETPVTVTILGDGAFMSNDRLGDEGNAALAMSLLGRYSALEWVLPRPGEMVGAAPGEGQGLISLLPDGVVMAGIQLFVAVAVIALWRGRRLGPVVEEPIPVVVRAAEAVEGRARLYQAASARERAAGTLRAGVVDRLTRLLGLAGNVDRAGVVAAIEQRSQRNAAGIDRLLFGPPPADDPQLVRLAAELDSLDSEVRHQ